MRIRVFHSTTCCCRHFVLAALITVLPACATFAQQPAQLTGSSQTSRGRNSIDSELAKENANRVAASSVLLKEILIADPGLMVELKDWIAKDASDNGQLVNDEDLTDSAVFDRLNSDV
ncbi:MAG TPA: hypothetical protein VMJ35_12715, partial [Dongiaceae bacterium]|nr:hypothetical protein [Dongiaceae bacterium]